MAYQITCGHATTVAVAMQLLLFGYRGAFGRRFVDGRRANLRWAAACLNPSGQLPWYNDATSNRRLYTEESRLMSALHDVEQILSHLARAEADLLRSYPTLRAEDLTNAWAYARVHQDETEQQILENETA